MKYIDLFISILLLYILYGIYESCDSQLRWKYIEKQLATGQWTTQFDECRPKEIKVTDKQLKSILSLKNSSFLGGNPLAFKEKSIELTKQQMKFFLKKGTNLELWDNEYDSYATLHLVKAIDKKHSMAIISTKSKSIHGYNYDHGWCYQMCIYDTLFCITDVLLIDNLQDFKYVSGNDSIDNYCTIESTISFSDNHHFTYKVLRHSHDIDKVKLQAKNVKESEKCTYWEISANGTFLMERVLKKIAGVSYWGDMNYYLPLEPFVSNESYLRRLNDAQDLSVDIPGWYRRDPERMLKWIYANDTLEGKNYNLLLKLKDCFKINLLNRKRVEKDITLLDNPEMKDFFSRYLISDCIKQIDGQNPSVSLPPKVHQ